MKGKLFYGLSLKRNAMFRKEQVFRAANGITRFCDGCEQEGIVGRRDGFKGGGILEAKRTGIVDVRKNCGPLVIS